MPEPRLSVIVPFFNETAFVDMAIGSILSQSLADIEVILVNDNPEDFPVAWLDGLGLPGMVRVLHHDRNRRLSAARNSGMAAATGAQIAFLDSDDYFVADGLAAQLELAERAGACITHAQCLRSHPGNPALSLLPRDKAMFGTARTGRGLAGIEKVQFFTSSWSSIYKASFLTEHTLRFDPEPVRFEDRLFVLQAVTAAQRIACLGAPVRVWRQRAGSIFSTPPDAQTHRLPLQLMEKCIAHMRAYTGANKGTGRFLKRELFNTLSRLIRDVGPIERLAAEDPAHDGFAQRISVMLGEERFSLQLFDDPVVRQFSRVGQKTRKGVIRRADVFAIHKALREGAPTQAARILAERRPASGGLAAGVSRTGPKLILHLGLHKTGTTALQHALVANREALHKAGVLFSQTGLPAPDHRAVRPGGLPGDLGLLKAGDKNDPSVFRALEAEIARSGCNTVILSCETMLLPLAEDRAAALAQLFAALSGFGQVHPIAFVRRPDQWAEMFYREMVCNGSRLGARTLPEFLVDYGDLLTSLPDLFARSSAEFTAARGYCPDLAALCAELGAEAWQPTVTLSAALLERLQNPRLRAEEQWSRDPPGGQQAAPAPRPGGWVVRISSRPWLVRCLQWGRERMRRAGRAVKGQ